MTQRLAGDRFGGAYLLLLLALIGVSQQADKVLFSMALEPIRLEFALSDSQLGLINGIAFALFFGFAAVPLARLGETMGRVRIIAGSIGAWSLFTTATALAAGFVGLFVTRVFVGIGEAGSGPAIQSLIAARFPPERRAGALSIALAGGYLGLTLGLAAGGVLVERLGWRGAFLGIGIPGLALAPLVWLTLREPPVPAPRDGGSFKDLLPVLRRAAFLNLFSLVALLSISGYGLLAWAPAFYMREYGMSASAVGAWLGLALGGGTIVGVLIGGALGDRFNRAEPGKGLSFVFWAMLVSTPIGISPFITHNLYLSLGLLLAATVIGTAIVAPIYAALHDLVEPHLRASAFAALSLGVLVVGQGLGPVIVGAISDLARMLNGQETLRTALIAVSLLTSGTIPHAHWLHRAYRREIALQGAAC